ncbi:PDDEXK-like family protein [Komagataeibacter diospyri]|uniref:PDDEXK-like family protein n=1 Tax=Komagataeibacter diospyri TaxID=1932662 RepID=UPI001396C707
MEIRHSAILSWLLDPRETHGFGDKFLRAFLCEAMRGQVELGSPTALEISQVDMRDAVVRREWQNIDIFILLPRLNWAFIIENKFHSRQHSGQLVKYTEKIKAIFEPQEGILKVRGIFLTLDDEPPEDENFAPIQYSAICEILPNLMENEAEIVRNDVAIFVKHYLEIIREETGMSEEREGVEALARQLYRAHKKALDFIMEYGATTDFVIAMESIFGAGVEDGDKFQVESQSFIFSWHNYESASFLPFGWVQKLGKDLSWEGCENWWAGYPLICWFHLNEDAEGTSGNLRLFAEVGPLSNYDFRKMLIENIDEAARENATKLITFQRGASEQGKKY